MAICQAAVCILCSIVFSQKYVGFASRQEVATPLEFASLKRIIKICLSYRTGLNPHVGKSVNCGNNKAAREEAQFLELLQVALF